jgi:hypothetical protein
VKADGDFATIPAGELRGLELSLADGAAKRIPG